MPKLKAAVAKKSDPKATLHREGQIMRERFAADHDLTVKAAQSLSRKTVGHLRALPQEEQAAFIRGMIEEGSIVFQPWATEILYVLGLMGRSRFTELQRLLGVSSRTLSDKLQVLRAHGLIEREVFDEQPVRIEYQLTKKGARVAVLGAAMFCELETQ